MNETIVGAGVLAVISVYLFINLRNKIDENSQRGNKPDFFTFAFLLISFSTFLFCTFLMGKSAIDNQDYCSILPNTTTINGSVTTLTYGRYCFVNTNETASSLFGLANYLIIASSILLLIMMIWAIWLAIKDIWDEYGKKF